MDLPDGSFDIVLDKATLDSILCGDGAASGGHKLLSEVSRVLAPEGAYVCVSHAWPQYRLNWLQRPEYGWNVKPFTIDKPSLGETAALSADAADHVHYVYLCSKGAAEE